MCCMWEELSSENEELKKEVSITNKVAEDWEDSFNDQQKEIEKLKILCLKYQEKYFALTDSDEDNETTLCGKCSQVFNSLGDTVDGGSGCKECCHSII